MARLCWWRELAPISSCTPPRHALMPDTKSHDVIAQENQLLYDWFKARGFAVAWRNAWKIPDEGSIMVSNHQPIC